MRTSFKTSLWVALAALGLTLAPARLAARDRDAVTADIPFSFMVENSTLPAGRYRVDRAMEDDLNAWIIRSTDGHSVAFLTQSVERSPGSSHPGSELIFTKIGDRHYLNEVWASGEGFRIVPSRSRLSAEAHEPTQQTVRVAGAK